MSHSMDAAAAIKQLAERDLSLLSDLRQLTDAGEISKRIMTSAANYDVVVAAEDVDALIRKSMRQVELAEILNELFNAEPALQQEFQSATETDDGVELIMAAAKRHNVVLDAEELSAHLRLVRDADATKELNDEELAGVTGGSAIGGVFLLGIVVAFVATGTILIAEELIKGNQRR